MQPRVLIRFALLATAAAAAPPVALAGFEPLEERPYREFFDPANPVKGEAVLGVSVVPASADEQRSNKVSVWFGEHYEGVLTVETLTADGAFRGVGGFRGATDHVGWNDVAIAPDPSQQRTRPANPEALAISVRGAKPNEFRIAHWGGRPASEDGLVLRLYVNGRRGDMSVRAGSVVERCKPVGLPRPLRFDVYCDLKMTDLPVSEESPMRSAIDLIRRDGFNIETQPIVILR